MKKKLLTLLLIVVIVFNFICVNSVYAEPTDSQTVNSKLIGEGTVSEEQTQEIMDNGSASGNEDYTPDSQGPSFWGFVFQIIGVVSDAFPMLIQNVMGEMAKNPKAPQAGMDSWFLSQVLEAAIDLAIKDNFFTVERAVFNEVALFNIDVFNLEDTYSLGVGEDAETIYQVGAIRLLKQNTAKWFYVCRLLAMMINLCVLIYVGIRMAFSTVASEETRYKKMLIDWATSMIILFMLQYIMTFAIQIGDVIMNVIYTIRKGMDVESFEYDIMATVYIKVMGTSGMKVFLYSVFFWFLTFVQFKFFLEYLKRVLSVMFLTIVAPFITVTFPIDKMADNKAQAFEAWLKEYIINIAIQPIHAAIYLIFVYSAANIAKAAPLIAMIFLLVLGRIENIIRNILGITKSTTVANIDDQMKKKGK